MARFRGGIVRVARGPRHLSLGTIESRFCCAYAFALLVKDRRFLHSERVRFDSRFDAFAKLQIEQAWKETFAGDIGVQSQGVRFRSLVRSFERCASRAEFKLSHVQLS